MSDNCKHPYLKKEIEPMSQQFWYKCANCLQKFKAEPWDGKVTVLPDK